MQQCINRINYVHDKEEHVARDLVVGHKISPSVTRQSKERVINWRSALISQHSCVYCQESLSEIYSWHVPGSKQNRL